MFLQVYQTVRSGTGEKKKTGEEKTGAKLAASNGRATLTSVELGKLLSVAIIRRTLLVFFYNI